MINWLQKKKPLRPLENFRDISLRHGNQRITYAPASHTLTCQNTVSPRHSPDEYSPEYHAPVSFPLNASEACACDAVITRCLELLPLTDEVDLLPPGASYDCYFTCTDHSGKKLYYTNTHTENRRIRQDPVAEEFKTAFTVLSCFVTFPQHIPLPMPLDDPPISDESRYFSETVWICEQCSAPNLLSHKRCVKCGAPRHW